MVEYINRDTFLEQQRAWYCKDCGRRKNSKGKTVYEIGEAPCRACDIGTMLDAVEDYPAADVVERKHLPEDVEELVTRLRSYNGWALNKTLDEAADAIESANKAYQMISEAYEAEVTKQNWIPVTETLPEEAYGCLAIVWDNNPYSGDTFLNYYPEFVGYGGGSWNDYNGDEIPLDVVYWMKLPQIPEPPEEE